MVKAKHKTRKTLVKEEVISKYIDIFMDKWNSVNKADIHPDIDSIEVTQFEMMRALKIEPSDIETSFGSWTNCMAYCEGARRRFFESNVTYTIGGGIQKIEVSDEPVKQYDHVDRHVVAEMKLTPQVIKQVARVGAPVPDLVTPVVEPLSSARGYVPHISYSPSGAAIVPPLSMLDRVENPARTRRQTPPASPQVGGEYERLLGGPKPRPVHHERPYVPEGSHVIPPPAPTVDVDYDHAWEKRFGKNAPRSVKLDESGLAPGRDTTTEAFRQRMNRIAEQKRLANGGVARHLDIVAGEGDVPAMPEEPKRYELPVRRVESVRASPIVANNRPVRMVRPSVDLDDIPDMPPEIKVQRVEPVAPPVFAPVPPPIPPVQRVEPVVPPVVAAPVMPASIDAVVASPALQVAPVFPYQQISAPTMERSYQNKEPGKFRRVLRNVWSAIKGLKYAMPDYTSELVEESIVDGVVPVSMQHEESVEITIDDEAWFATAEEVKNDFPEIIIDEGIIIEAADNLQEPAVPEKMEVPPRRTSVSGSFVLAEVDGSRKRTITPPALPAAALVERNITPPRGVPIQASKPATPAQGVPVFVPQPVPVYVAPAPVAAKPVTPPSVPVAQPVQREDADYLALMMQSSARREPSPPQHDTSLLEQMVKAGQEPAAVRQVISLADLKRSYVSGQVPAAKPIVKTGNAVPPPPPADALRPRTITPPRGVRVPTPAQGVPAYVAPAARTDDAVPVAVDVVDTAKTPVPVYAGPRLVTPLPAVVAHTEDYAKPKDDSNYIAPQKAEEKTVESKLEEIAAKPDVVEKRTGRRNAAAARSEAASTRRRRKAVVQPAQQAYVAQSGTKQAVASGTTYAVDEPAAPVVSESYAASSSAPVDSGIPYVVPEGEFPAETTKRIEPSVLESMLEAQRRLNGTDPKEDYVAPQGNSILDSMIEPAPVSNPVLDAIASAAPVVEPVYVESVAPVEAATEVPVAQVAAPVYVEPAAPVEAVAGVVPEPIEQEIELVIDETDIVPYHSPPPIPETKPALDAVVEAAEVQLSDSDMEEVKEPDYGTVIVKPLEAPKKGILYSLGEKLRKVKEERKQKKAVAASVPAPKSSRVSSRAAGIAAAVLISAVTAGTIGALYSTDSGKTNYRRPAAVMVAQNVQASAPAAAPTEAPASSVQVEYAAKPCNDLELRLNARRDSVRFNVNDAKSRLEKYVQEAAKAGHKKVHVYGFASIEGPSDKKNPILNDDPYNVKLAERRQSKAKSLLQQYVQAHKLDIEIVTSDNFAETEAWGTGKQNYAANRTVLMTTRPIENPNKDKETAKEIAKNTAGTIYKGVCAVASPKVDKGPEKQGAIQQSSNPSSLYALFQSIVPDMAPDIDEPYASYELSGYVDSTVRGIEVKKKETSLPKVMVDSSYARSLKARHLGVEKFDVPVLSTGQHIIDDAYASYELVQERRSMSASGIMETENTPYVAVKKQSSLVATQKPEEKQVVDAYGRKYAGPEGLARLKQRLNGSSGGKYSRPEGLEMLRQRLLYNQVKAV